MRLIDLDNVKPMDFPSYEMDGLDVIRYLNTLPTVDAVEVVRCKDCKHWHEETGWCTIHSHFVDSYGMACHPSESSDWKMFDADYFCKDGERKGPNENR